MYDTLFISFLYFLINFFFLRTIFRVGILFTDSLCHAVVWNLKCFVSLFLFEISSTYWSSNWWSVSWASSVLPKAWTFNWGLYIQENHFRILFFLYLCTLFRFSPLIILLFIQSTARTKRSILEERKNCRIIFLCLFIKNGHIW